MERKLNILMLVKRFAHTMPKHQHKYDMLTAIGTEANVVYWERDGDIFDILGEIEMKPDFIFHYDFEWHNAFAPAISNLNKVAILKGCYVLDVHYYPPSRTAYFNVGAKPDIIFSASKYPFLRAFPGCASRFHWLPFGVNPAMFRDYGLDKDIPYSLMGLMDDKYPFRHEVLKQMGNEPGFAHFKHPGHRTGPRPGLFVHEAYAKAINRSQMTFTCGSHLRIPVAKFFEIPACRTLMLAERNEDIEELGFRDGEHYAACDMHNIRTKALHYAAAADERLRIADTGHAFIHTQHTNAIRAQQFVAAVKAMLSGREGSPEASL